jgi:hypothetical protein
MPSPVFEHAVTALAAASGGSHDPDLLRIVIIGGVFGAAFLGWFLLRGYRRED